MENDVTSTASINPGHGPAPREREKGQETKEEAPCLCWQSGGRKLLNDAIIVHYCY